MMFGVLAVCVECNEPFQRGIYPQKICDSCSMGNTHVFNNGG